VHLSSKLHTCCKGFMTILWKQTGQHCKPQIHHLSMRRDAGYLVHTNEVTLQLGANTAVHTSTAHAQQVLRRRRAYVDQQAASVRQQIAALEARADFAPAHETGDEARRPLCAALRSRDACYNHRVHAITLWR
jgi:Prefoldin subunit